MHRLGRVWQRAPGLGMVPSSSEHRNRSPSLERGAPSRSHTHPGSGTALPHAPFRRPGPGGSPATAPGRRCRHSRAPRAAVSQAARYRKERRAAISFQNVSCLRRAASPRLPAASSATAVCTVPTERAGLAPPPCSAPHASPVPEPGRASGPRRSVGLSPAAGTGPQGPMQELSVGGDGTDSPAALTPLPPPPAHSTACTGNTGVLVSSPRTPWPRLELPARAGGQQGTAKPAQTATVLGMGRLACFTPACGFQLSARRRQRPPGAGGELLLEARCFDGFCLSLAEEQWQPMVLPQRHRGGGSQPSWPARAPGPRWKPPGPGATGLTEEVWPALETQRAPPGAEAMDPAAGGQRWDWQCWDQPSVPANLGAKNGELASL